MKALNCLFEAFSWLNRPKLRLFVWIPLLINVVVFGGATWGLLHYFDVLMNRFLPENSWLHYFRWIAWPLIALTLVIVVFYTFSLLANIIAAPFNGFLADAVERLETGQAPESGLNLAQEIWLSIWQEIKKTLFFLSRAIPIFLLGFIPVVNLIVPILWFIYSAWVAYLQYMDYPMANNGIFFSRQRQILRGQPIEMFGFGGLATVMLSIPVLNLIAMPVAVIGATLHWSRHIKPNISQLPNNHS